MAHFGFCDDCNLWARRPNCNGAVPHCSLALGSAYALEVKAYKAV